MPGEPHIRGTRNVAAGAHARRARLQLRGDPLTWALRVRPRLRLGFACALILSVFLPGESAADEAMRSVAMPLRMVNLNPFHLLYEVPASAGARVMSAGSTEVIASIDMASHLRASRSGAERILLDGETYRQGLALRHGLGDGWEYLLDISAVAHSGGIFDGFIESWHGVFGLPQGGRESAPRDRLALFYADEGGTRFGVDRSVYSLGNASLGLGYALLSSPLANDGLALRAVLTLPTGDEEKLAGSGGFSASAWAETSGALPGSEDSRRWLYAATLGALAGEAPEDLVAIGGRFIVFGRLGVTWRAVDDLHLTVQVDVHSSPYGASALSPLSDVAVMLGFGGMLRINERLALEIAVTEDDGVRHSAPDIGLHTALRWRL